MWQTEATLSTLLAELHQLSLNTGRSVHQCSHHNIPAIASSSLLSVNPNSQLDSQSTWATCNQAWPWNWHVKVNPVFISERSRPPSWSDLLDLAQEIHKMMLSSKPISGIKDLDYHPLHLFSRSLVFVSFSWSVAVCPSPGPCALVGSVDWYAAGIFGSRWFHAPPRFPRALGALCYLCGAQSVW